MLWLIHPIQRGSMTLNTPTKLILTAFASIAVTVFALDSRGYLRHSSEQDSIYLAEFSLLASTPGVSQTISAKPADFSARCEQGILVLDASGKNMNPNLSGLLVDKKSRAVNCLF